MKNINHIILCLLSLWICSGRSFAQTYRLADTGQTAFFDNRGRIAEPSPGDPFYGQDAQYTRNPPSYRDNGDGTVSDLLTGLVWQKAYFVLTYDEAIKKAKTFSLAGKKDWRLPSIKEVYSLALFSGVDASSRDMSIVPPDARAFIDGVFDFEYGANGERRIDTQILSSTKYRGSTMGKQKTVFGFNAADGRIKGYPVSDPRTRSGKKFTVRFVRGKKNYDRNLFQDNGDGTISDLATGLMWAKEDSSFGMDWQSALDWVQKMNSAVHLGYGDWRLPNAKEMQSIVDYDRSPQSTNSPAISPLFSVSAISDESGNTNYPFFWTSTTHESSRGGFDAVYICFGDAFGYFKPPGSSIKPMLMDVHGAGAQRSDPKAGSTADFPVGRGPQGDVIRIDNFVRIVRNIQ